MLKRSLTVLLLACALSAQAVNRNISETWDIGRTPRTPQEIYFLQAESVQFDLTVYENGAPCQLTNANLAVVWELSSGANYTNLVAVGTGTVTSATGGVVRLTLTPEQSNLTNGTYNGYVIAAVSDGTNLTDRVVLARQTIAVAWSPYGLEYEYVGLTAPFYSKAETDGLLTPLFSFTNTQFSVNTNFEQRIAALEALPEGPTNSVTVVIVNGVTNTPVDGVVDLGETTDPYAVTRIFINGVANYPVFGSVDLGTITGVDTNAVKKIILNGVTNTPSSGTVTLPTIPTNPVTKIILNGVTNTPSSGTVDLGTITSGGAVTNVSVYPPNDCVVLAVPTDAFIVSGAGLSIANGLYTQTTSTLYTNAATGAYCWFDPDSWLIDYDGGTTAYILNTTNQLPWLASEAWENASTLPLPTLTGYSTNKLASLSNSFQWVSCPTGSTASGSARQVSYSADTNRFFYFFQPAAVSGSTTGIWLRVLGESF